jgi:adenylate cyclase
MPLAVQAGLSGNMPPNEIWRLALSGEDTRMYKWRHLFGLIPSDPRCQICNAPFRGPLTPLFRALNFTRAQMNPHFCAQCLEVLPEGGAELDITMLFADIRGSTSLAEAKTPIEFTRLLNRFYEAATRVMVESDALIDKLVGDEVIGLYAPGFAGPDYSKRAIKAAQRLLQVTGHGDPGGPWVPVGVAVHVGFVYMGRVGSEATITDITALGDPVNVTARLASSAAAGEVLVTEDPLRSARMTLPGGTETRSLMLKGKTEAVRVSVLKSAA